MNCSQCKKEFNITQKDQEFYQRIKTPLPTFCPACRCQRRLAMRNERTLYPDKCDLCGKNIISLYSPNKPYKTYCYDCFYSDKWNPLNYGQEFDFNKPFFPQFKELQLKVPRINAMCLANENSDYTNGSGYNKNCYMIFVSDHNENCQYSYSIFDCHNVVDCLNSHNCELCYECSGCFNCFNCQNLIDCSDCNESKHCFDCKGCTSCLGCVGLRHKEYYIYNKQYSPEDYQKWIETHCNASVQLNEFNQLKQNHHHLYRHGLKNENSTGDYINRCKDSINCYDSYDLENCQNIINGNKVTDSQDGYMIGDNTELSYEIIAALNCHFCKFNFFTFNATDCEYTDSCSKVKNLFGCVGFKSEEFCILNKKYEEKAYFDLKEKIIEHMKKTKEYGEFFPAAQSPFAYNESAASEFFPLTQKQVQKIGCIWEEKDVKNINPSLPICKQCHKNFNFIAQETKFYQDQKIIQPELCFNCRHENRLKQRNERNLYERQCTACSKKLISTFSTQRPEKIYCETCYNKYIY